MLFCFFNLLPVFHNYYLLQQMKVTFLGTGTSGGVPMIGCECEVCRSADSRDKRLRTSILIEIDGKKIVVDAGPDFRQQMLTHQIKNIDAILITHGHRDHVGGLDDVRPFNFLHDKFIEVYCDKWALEMIKEQYAYAFKSTDYDYAPKMNFNIIEKDIFKIENTTITPIRVMHQHLPITAFRIADFTYITDAKTISEEEKAKIKGTKTLVVNALRLHHHVSHFTLEEALAFIKEINPDQAFLIHMSHQFGLQKEMQKQLPSNVTISYDGMIIEV